MEITSCGDLKAKRKKKNKKKQESIFGSFLVFCINPVNCYENHRLYTALGGRDAFIIRLKINSATSSLFSSFIFHEELKKKNTQKDKRDEHEMCEKMQKGAKFSFFFCYFQLAFFCPLFVLKQILLVNTVSRNFLASFSPLN